MQLWTQEAELSAACLWQRLTDLLQSLSLNKTQVAFKLLPENKRNSSLRSLCLFSPHFFSPSQDSSLFQIYSKFL